jgi:acyl-CoA dehydrogenase
LKIELPAHTEEILEGLRQFLRREVASRHRAHNDLLGDHRRIYDESGAYTAEVMALRREVRTASARAGFYTLFAPAELGGGGEGALTMYCAWEQIYHSCGPLEWLGYDALTHWVTGPSPIFNLATPRVRETVVPKLNCGEATMCFGMSEPDAGSDVWRMQTRATKSDSGWRINGLKTWTSNGPYADYALVFAVTDGGAVAARQGGITCFIVPTDTAGFKVEKVVTLFGHVGGNEGTISLSDVEVPDDAVIGEVGKGIDVGLVGLALGRLYNAGKSVGLARWAIERGLDYAKERVTFGKPLIEHQSIGFAFAESAMQILPAHLLGLHAARLVDEGKPALMETAMAKAVSTEMGARVVDQVVQAFGGAGLTNEIGLTKAWQDLRIVQIADGSAQMLRRIIVNRLSAGDLEL